MKIKVFSVLMILMVLSSSFASAANLDKTEKVTDKTKTTAKEITSKSSGIGKVTVTDTDTSKYKVVKKSKNEISVSKQEISGEHTKAIVSFTKDDIEKIDIDKDGLYGVLHIADDGTTTHDVVTESELIAGTEMTFSENIVSGYLGYWEKTQTGVTSGTKIDIPDVSGSDYYVTYSLNGTIPTYTAIPETDKTKYPSGAVLLMPMNNATNLVTGNTATNVNTTFSGGAGIFNGLSYLSFAHTRLMNITGNMTMIAEFTASTPTSTAGIISRNTYNPYELITQTYFKYQASNATGYKTSSGTTITANTRTFRAVTRNAGAGTVDFYREGVRESTVSGVLGNLTRTTNPLYVGARSSTSGKFTGSIYRAMVFNRSLSGSEIASIYAGGSGISVRPSPSYNFTGYNVVSGTGKIIDTDATCTGLEYVDTTSGTHTVTVRIYFTEDITKVSETFTPHTQNVHITHTKLNGTAQTGEIVYDINSTYWNQPVMSTNNTNATISRNTTSIIIDTGYLKVGQTFYYDVTLTDWYGDSAVNDDISDTYITLSDDIDSAFVLAALVLTITIGLTMLVLLSSILTGTIDFKMAVASVLIVIISEAVILFGLILISQIYDGLLYI